MNTENTTPVSSPSGKQASVKNYHIGLGRRKTAVARVRLFPGTGKGGVKVNGKVMGKYFPSANLVTIAQKPLVLTNTSEKYDIVALLDGGGYSGQAGALALGISRALIRSEPQLRSGLKRAGLLTRDPRERERKKYGRRGARRRFQFSKR